MEDDDEYVDVADVILFYFSSALKWFKFIGWDFDSSPIFFICVCFSVFKWELQIIFVKKQFRNDPQVETLELGENAELINPPNTKVGPEDFQLLKVLGKGGYGKVNKYIFKLS
jgi:hypothetical protein